MKKLIVLIVLMFVVFSCSNKDKVKQKYKWGEVPELVTTTPEGVKIYRTGYGVTVIYIAVPPSGESVSIAIR